MKIILTLSLILLASKFTNSENCDKHGILLYEDMGCRPTYDNSNSCPSKYECDGLRISNTQCFFRGDTYSSGEIARNSSFIWGCSCSTDSKWKSSKFSCPQYGCQDWGRAPGPGCYWTYDLNKPCASGTRCPKPGEKVTTCAVDGIEYKEGQQFVPKDSCHVCICREGFKGKYEAPFCRRADCGVQLLNQDKIQAKCAPVYEDNSRKENGILCCPSKWICPDDEENTGHDNGQNTSAGKCSFGETTLHIGESFEKNITNYGGSKMYKCECRIPPLLTCVGV